MQIDWEFSPNITLEFFFIYLSKNIIVKKWTEDNLWSFIGIEHLSPTRNLFFYFFDDTFQG